MEHRDPRGLIVEAAGRLRRRRLANLVLPALPVAIVLAALAAAGKLPGVAVVAAAIAASGLLILVLRISAPGLEAARRLDEATDGHDHFLTLATTRIESPLREIVESGASRLGARVRLSSLLPPLQWRRVGLGILVSATLATLLLFPPRLPVPTPEPADRLERIANDLERSGTERNAALARELRVLAETLRNPETTPEERRQAIEQTRQQLERQEEQSGDDGGGKEGGGGAAGETAGEARGEARRELEKLSGTTGGGDSDGDEAGEREGGERQEPSGAGVDAPPPDPSGASEREAAEGEGNRPEDSRTAERQERGAGSGGERRDTDRQDEGGEAPRPDLAGGTGGAGAAPVPGLPEGEAELPGEGPGWTTLDGGFVRVRVPEGEDEALETERVTGPGQVRPATPFGNAPLPGAGAAGEAERTQPLPLEYRSVLVPEGERTR